MLCRYAQAGSLESGDVMVRVAPSEQEGVVVRVESKVSARFLTAIQQTVLQMAADMGVTAASFEIIDRGALDFVLRARVATALKRAMEVDGND